MLMLQTANDGAICLGFEAKLKIEVAPLLHACREHGLEVRAFLFPRDHRDLDLTKSGLLQQLMQLHFAKPEPMICVEFTRAFEAVTEQVENHEASAFLQNAMRCLNGAL